MQCYCCQNSCDDTFNLHGYVVCFDCTMRKSHEEIMNAIRERLHVNVNSWGVS